MKIFPLIFILIFSQGCVGATIFFGIVGAGQNLIQDKKIEKLENELEMCRQPETQCVT